jgi:hypothetical protein
MNKVVEPVATATLKKEEWIEALRSGEYRQGTDHLYNSGAYCCLGVLCRIAGAAFNEERTVYRHNDDGEIYPSTADTTVYISEELWAEDGEFTDRMREHFGLGESVHSKLIEMNDGRKDIPQKSFAEIADWIETHDLKTGKELTSSPKGGSHD